MDTKDFEAGRKITCPSLILWGATGSVGRNSKPAPAEIWQRYAADIRKEYAWVPEPEYRGARGKVLKHFLARPRLYWTDAMYDECETQARENLSRELAVMDT